MEYVTAPEAEPCAAGACCEAVTTAAAHNNDALITRHLRERADSLGLPEAAGEVSVQRDGRHIEIESEYYVHIELPLMVREVRFNPHAEGIF